MYRKMLGNPSAGSAPVKCKDKLPWVRGGAGIPTGGGHSKALGSPRRWGAQGTGLGGANAALGLFGAVLLGLLVPTTLSPSPPCCPRPHHAVPVPFAVHPLEVALWGDSHRAGRRGPVRGHRSEELRTAAPGHVWFLFLFFPLSPNPLPSVTQQPRNDPTGPEPQVPDPTAPQLHPGRTRRCRGAGKRLLKGKLHQGIRWGRARGTRNEIFFPPLPRHFPGACNAQRKPKNPGDTTDTEREALEPSYPGRSCRA